MGLYNGKILDETNPTGTTNSTVIDMRGQNGVSFHFTAFDTTGSSVVYQESNDGGSKNSAETAQNFITNTDVTIATTGTQMIIVSDVRCRYVRIQYVHSSGTGALTCWANTKGMG